LSDDTVRLSMIGRILRGRWPLLVVLAVLGGIAGFGASLLFSPGYQTSASVLLQGPREADELLTQAEVAHSSVVLDRAATALGWHVTGTELQDSVSASVANGNVIQITGRAESPERAQRLTDQVAQQYVRFSTQLISNTADGSGQALQEQREKLRQQVQETNGRIDELAKSASQGLTVESVQARTQLEALRSSLNRAMTNLDQADAATSQANMVIMGQAERPTSPAPPTMPQFVAGGALLFVLLGVLGHLFAARADRRLRNAAEIAAALGSAALASVDVPDDDRVRTQRKGRLRARRLLGGDQPWNLPRPQASGDERSRAVRYRRVLARLPGGDARRHVLVAVADDDAVARRAAERLAAAARDEGGPLTLSVVEVSVARPTVPDGADIAGVLVVLTAGTRTAWELVGIAEACADAGHAVVGVVLAHRVRTGHQRDDAVVPAVPAVPADDVMAGSP
jgi:capsular polysaccharide biosynthesis protein